MPASATPKQGGITETQEFLKKYGPSLGGNIHLWLTRFFTLSEAWLACSDVQTMIAMMRDGKDANYQTALLVFSGNLTIDLAEVISTPEAITCANQLSNMIARCVGGQRGGELYNEAGVLRARCTNILGRYQPRMPPQDRESVSWVLNIATNFQLPKLAALSIAHSTAEWHTRVHLLLGRIASQNTAIELKRLLGNPFER